MKNNKHKKKKTDLKQELIRSWWVIAFLLFSYVFFVQTTQPFRKTYQELEHSLNSLKHKKNKLEYSIEELRKTVASQNDPTWIEQVLKDKLNRIPEGQKKIIFNQKGDH